MTGRILSILKLLCVGLALAALCAADDTSQAPVPDPDAGSANQHSRILRTEGPQTLPVAAPRQLLAGAILSNAASQDEFDGMEKTLAGYQGAFEAMSLRQMITVWPELDRRREAAFRDVFSYLRKTVSAPQLKLECAAPTMIEATVSIECRQALTYRLENRKSKTLGPVRVAIVLKRQPHEWVIHNIEGL